MDTTRTCGCKLQLSPCTCANNFNVTSFWGVDKHRFWLIFGPNLPFFLHNLRTNLAKKRMNTLSLAHFVLTSGISQFSGILPKNERVLAILPKKGALVLEFRQEWRFNEALGTKRIRTSSCCRGTVDCRVSTTMPWSQKLRTVRRKTVHLNRARSLGCTGARAFRHDRASSVFLAT